MYTTHLKLVPICKVLSHIWNRITLSPPPQDRYFSLHLPPPPPNPPGAGGGDIDSDI